MSHPTCCSVSLDRCDRCDLLVDLEYFHLMSVARTPDALVLDVESCNQLVGPGFLCGSGASNAPHRSHQRTLSNQAEKPPEATATPTTTNSECSSSPEAQMPPPHSTLKSPKCMSAVPVTGRRRLIQNAHIQRSRYMFVTAPEYRFLSTRELQTEELLLLKVELILGQDAHINEFLQLLQRLNLLVRRHLGSGRFRGLSLWTDGLRHIHAE